MNAVIYVKPASTNTIVGHILINNSTFYKNRNVNFIIVKKEYQTLWYVTTFIWLHHVNISNNNQGKGSSLILATSGIITLSYVTINQNRYYRNILSLRSSMLLFQHYTEISKNYARHAIKA